MNKEQYLAKREELVNKSQKLIDEGKAKESKEVNEEIKNLDNKFELSAKVQANLNALKDNHSITDIQNYGVNVEGRTIDSIAKDNVEKPDMYDSVEYRKSFMNYVLTGARMPGKFVNADASTKTSDVGSVIPTTILQRIVEKLESTGMILPLVTKTGYQGGVSVPTSSAKPVATWTAEGTGSDKQKKATGSVVFAYYKLRCAVSVSFEVSVVTLGIFETTIINNIAEAMTKALEQAIISGTGVGQPKGVLAETVAEGQNIDIAASKEPDYKTLVDAEAALPLAYENGAVWCMTKKTFMSFVGMVDGNGQPIARVSYGISGRPERSLLGRTVVLNDYMSNAVPTADTVVAFLFNFSDYLLNLNYNMTVKRYEDNDTDDQVTKAILLADGKVIDKNSLVTVTKKTSA
jgi:HK97 family phage major capsid protein